MATLELLIDASGMQRGAQQAEQSLQRVKSAVDSVYGATVTFDKQAQKVGTSLSNAFQATGGSIQIAQGITQTARAFGELNTAAGLFSASRVLLEVGKTADDFRQLSGAVRTSGGLWATLGSIMRAHPLLTIATVIGTAASAMSLFGNSARKAATDWDALGESMRKAQASNQVSDFLGVPRGDATGRIRAQLEALAGASGGELVDLSRAQDVLGYSSRGALISDLAKLGNMQAQQFRDGGFYYPPGRGIFDLQASGQPYPTSQDSARISVTVDELRQIYRQQYANAATGAGRAGGYRPQSFLGPLGPGSESPFSDRAGVFGFQRSEYVTIDAVDQRGVDVEHAQVMAERVAENMARAADYAEQIGQSFGAAVADVVLGATSLRQALAGLVQQGARQGLASAFGAAFGALGKTFAQSQGDQGFTAPGTTPRAGT